jgi:pimeloyl-ACP methyl ester carboxylesterase
VIEDLPLLRRSAVDGVELAHRIGGDGPPVVLIHGSWDDHRSWDEVAARLRATCRVLAYDRRGHSASTAPPGQGRIGEDVEDAAALLERHGLAPASVVGHSYGASVALLLAVRRPDLVRRVVVHEPPLYALLAGDDEWDAVRRKAGETMAEVAAALIDGEVEVAARRFVEEVAFGAGSWPGLLCERGRATVLANADTWLDQSRDPDRLAVDVTPLATSGIPVTVTTGTATIAAFAEIARRLVAALPESELVPIDGAAHGAHLSHPERFAAVVAARVHGW